MYLEAILFFVLGLIVHELGHWWFARENPLELGIGMGRELFHFHIGDTRITMKLIPIAGYCLFDSIDPRVYLGGIATNVLFGTVLVLLGFLLGYYILFIGGLINLIMGTATLFTDGRLYLQNRQVA